MEPPSDINAPFLIVVTGRPGSGKTTLAHRLAQAIRCPVLCRDEFKEGLVRTFRAPATLDDHARLNRHVYDAFFQAVELLLRNRITLVAEAAFQHKLWQPKLEPLRSIAQLRLVVCSIDPALARTRFVERGLADHERELYHPGSMGQTITPDAERLITGYEAPQLAGLPLLNVDTRNGYTPALEQIAEFALQ